MIKFLKIILVKEFCIFCYRSYVPLCGPYFILNFDLSIYTEFIEISPEKLLNIFSVFSKLPEFSKTDLYMMTKEEMAENESESEDENN